METEHYQKNWPQHTETNRINKFKSIHVTRSTISYHIYINSCTIISYSDTQRVVNSYIFRPFPAIFKEAFNNEK